MNEQAKKISRQQHCIEVANTIRRQISLQTQMAIGAREFKCGYSSDDMPHLTMRVRDGKYFVRITLTPADTYIVELFQQLRNTPYALKQIQEFEDVYCEQLSTLIYHMVNK